MTEFECAYLAGLLDGDGSIMLQFHPRKDMKYLFRLKAVVVFYQHSKAHHELIKIHKRIQAGYVYRRNDRISEIRIEGHRQVESLLTQLQPFIRLKKEQVVLCLKALTLAKKKPSSVAHLLKIAQLADQISQKNYTSSTRKYTRLYIQRVLMQSELIPVTTGFSRQGGG